MTAELLDQQLRQAEANLRQITYDLSLISSSLPQLCIDKLESLESVADHLASISNLIEAREVAQQFLQRLPSLTVAGSTNLVNHLGTQVPFGAIRLFGFQGYLSLTWAVCDSVTTAIAPLICTEAACNNRKNPPQLLTNFVKNGSKETPYYGSVFLSMSYGWAIGVSYVIRNHFVHDGASFYGKDFFAGTSIVDRFSISQTGWDFLEQQLKNNHQLANTQTRVVLPWPWHQNNLLQLLELCNDEIDEALEYLIGSSVEAVVIQARHLLKRDVNFNII